MASYTYEVAQGATLVAPFQVMVDAQPADLTNAFFKTTLKPAIDLPDTDPTVIKIDWQEGSNPTSGLTSLVVPAETTQEMLPVQYYGQTRVEGVPKLPAVYDLMNLIVIITQPVSSRF